MRRRVSLLFFELEGWWRRIRREAIRPGRVTGRDTAREQVDARTVLRMRVRGRIQPL